MILKDGSFQNETRDQNDFGRSEVDILNGQKKWFWEMIFGYLLHLKNHFPRLGWYYKSTFSDSHADSQLSRVAQKREVQRESVFRTGDESEMI